MTSSVSGKAEYSVNVTASGGSVFESGNNWRLLEIKVTDQTTDTTLPADAFATTWRTTTADKSITLPISGSDMTVDWGDGNTTTGVSGQSITPTILPATTPSPYQAALRGSTLTVSNPTQAGWHQSSSGATRDGPLCTRRFTGPATWCTTQTTLQTSPQSPTCPACSETPLPSTATSPAGMSQR